MGFVGTGMRIYGIRNLSLRARFAIVFSGLLALAILFCSLLLWEQHRTAVHGADLAVQTQNQIIASTRMRETLADLDRRARNGEPLTDQVKQFRNLSRQALERQPEEVARELDERFTGYLNSLSPAPAGDANLATVVRERYDDALAAVNHVIENSEAGTYFMAEKLRNDQHRSIRAAIGFLTLFLLLLALAGYKIIEIITEPLSSLVTFLDQVDVEDDLPVSIPSFNSNVPEVQHVARSFERLLSRLRGYRALNVRRLLIEKRRADIIAASITDGIFLLRNDEILYMNPVAERILGYSGAPGAKSLSLAQYQDLAGGKAILKAVSRSMPAEFTRDEPNRKAYYMIQAYPLDNGVIEQAEPSLSDTSVATDALLERFQANMMIVAQDVTLVHESQEAKRHFLGTLSHEVKTPVTSLTMATRLLKRNIDQIENPMHKALITTCIDDVDRLRGLLEDLLTVTRFETITQRMEVQTIDLGKLVRHAVQDFQKEARERGIELTSKITGNGKPMMVPVDATKIAWALSNLLTNALRHTPPNGKVQADIDGSDDQVQIRVRDSGPGIDRKRQGRIFDKFNPFYDLRVARSGGAGVGLAIAREIVVAHGGKIWVTSEPGQGAEFCFTVPFKRASGMSMDEGPQTAGANEEKIEIGLKSQLECMKGATRGTSTGG
jgi:signal transduction histidine kinase